MIDVPKAMSIVRQSGSREEAIECLMKELNLNKREAKEFTDAIMRSVH
jgi:hypothetical protein